VETIGVIDPDATPACFDFCCVYEVTGQSSHKPCNYRVRRWHPGIGTSEVLQIQNQNYVDIIRAIPLGSHCGPEPVRTLEKCFEIHWANLFVIRQKVAHVIVGCHDLFAPGFVQADFAQKILK
jgi:hypothetical protein